VDRAALEASDAVTATFLDRVDDLSARVGGDARRLLEGLEEGQVARFRNEARDQLKDWLLDHGYLDDRPVLDEAGLRQRLLEALAQHGTSSGAEGVDAAALLDEADRLTRWWSVAVGAGGPFQSRLTTRRESSANPSRS
jgi:hypothetical protein